MLIDLKTERPISLKDACVHPLIVRGHRDKNGAAYSTLWRWHKSGLNGVLLETVRIGSTLCTTEEALIRFFQKLPTGAPLPPVITDKDQKRAHQLAKQRLAAAGI